MRTLIGLAVGSGLEGVDAVAIRTEGIGLDLKPTVASSIRVAFPLTVRDAIREASTGGHFPFPDDVIRNISDTAVHATRHVLTKSGASLRDTFAAGLLNPAHSIAEPRIAWPEIADRIAEQTGLTVLHGFRHRDRATGGAGHPVTAAADYLLFTSHHQPRLLIHLGSVASVLFIPQAANISAVRGFDAGPGSQLLDALIHHGTRGKESADPGGKRSVQGQCLEPLLDRWREHPHLTRTPPKVIHPEAFGRSFLLAAFESVRQMGASLTDLLCSATHLIARSVGEGVRQWLPNSVGTRRILVTGGGVRNGFLWQLVAQQFGNERIERSDEVGVPSLARNAASAAILAALTCDGVAGNLSSLTGATGGRLLGHLTPGDGRNWAKVTAWLADQTVEYPRVNRAA
jgi:anhydro-N-acetylmuramic acid kinase